MAEDAVDMTWWTTTIQPKNDDECIKLMRKALRDAGEPAAYQVLLRYMNNRKLAHDMLVARKGKK